MKTLSKQQIAFLSNHMEAMDRAYKTQIYFLFDSKSSGQEAFNFLKNVYSDECNYDAWSGWFGLGDKRDFYLGFISAQARDNVYNDIKNARDAYESTNQYQENLDGENGSLNDGVDSSGITQNTFTNNSTTYIIIGAAVIILVLLLWDRKKK